MTANSNKVGAHGENSASFEESFARLQDVVGRLSAGSLSLQDALAAFEEGMMLADRCAQMLDEAELRVKQVSERALRAGSASLVDLDEVIRALPDARSNEPVILEIETYESTIVMSGQAAESSAQEREPEMGGPFAPTRKNKPEPRPIPKPLLDDLDPLFDDD